MVLNKKFLYPFYFLNTLSVLGIWPCFVEPNLLKTTQVYFSMKNCPNVLQKIKIVFFSDLHYHKKTSWSRLFFLHQTIQKLKPDLVLFGGDFICYSQLQKSTLLEKFLNLFHAPYGCYAVLGNHDYAQYVSLSQQNIPEIIESPTNLFSRLWHKNNRSHKNTSPNPLHTIPPHPELLKVLHNSPFQLLHNTIQTIHTPHGPFNLCGLGEYWLDQMKEDAIKEKLDPNIPTLICMHNPDAISQLSTTDPYYILSGHTHGGQINIPFFWNYFTRLKNPLFKRGKITYPPHKVYVSSGVGSTLPFRLGSIPEVATIGWREEND